MTLAPEELDALGEAAKERGVSRSRAVGALALEEGARRAKRGPIVRLIAARVEVLGKATDTGASVVLVHTMTPDGAAHVFVYPPGVARQLADQLVLAANLATDAQAEGAAEGGGPHTGGDDDRGDDSGDGKRGA